MGPLGICGLQIKKCWPRRISLVKTLLGTWRKRREMRVGRTFQVEQPEQRPQGQGGGGNVCAMDTYGWGCVCVCVHSAGSGEKMMDK